MRKFATSIRKKTTKVGIAEALYEIIAHTAYEKDARDYLDRLTENKNIFLDYEKGIVEIQNSEGTKALHTITIT